MKILYDSQCFEMQKSGGISRYFCEIIQHLPNTTKFDLRTAYSRNIYLNEKKIVELYENDVFIKMNTFFPNVNFRGKYRLQQIRKKLFFNDFKTNRYRDIEALKKQEFDLFHPTYYDPYFLDYIGNKPFVLTIHDMIHEKYPEMLCDIKTIKNKKLLAKKATHIIAISEQTKQDIKDILNIPDSKISVIYHGTVKQQLVQKNSDNIYGTYILFTGTRTIYKNFYFMLISLADWLKSNEEIKLICTSSDFSEFEKKLIIDLGLENKVIHVFFNNDEEMYLLYKNALAFIFPSYYEGFGIPILEAFESNCPLILADASCFKEIAGDAAIYFDPKSKNQLIQAVDKVYNDSKIRNEIIQKGSIRIKEYSWDKAAEQTNIVYKTCLEVE